MASSKVSPADNPVEPTASSTVIGEKTASGGGGSSDHNHPNTSSSPTTKKPSSPSLRNAAKSPVAGKKVKSSFWGSLVSVLLPCISHKGASRAHDISPQLSDTPAVKEKAAISEKQAQLPPSVEVPGASTSAPVTSHTPNDGQSTPTKGKSAPPALIFPTTTNAEVIDNVAVIVPPSPTTHLLPTSETEGVTSGAVQPPGSTGNESHLQHPPTTAGTTTITTDSDDASLTDDADAEAADNEAGPDVEDEDDEERILIEQGGTGIPIGPDGKPAPLLPPVSEAHKGRKCLVLDLDETLLHSSFKLIPQADYVVPVEIEWQWHNVYVIKRPGVDAFLKEMGQIYEVVVFTASLSKYADPVLDKLDIHKVVAHRLFRESCYNHKGNYVKDLSRLGRPIADTIILDNSPASYIFHPNNAVPVSSWFNDPHDTELTDLCPFLTDLAPVDDVRGILDGGL